MSLRSNDIVSFWFWGYRGYLRIELQAPMTTVAFGSESVKSGKKAKWLKSTPVSNRDFLSLKYPYSNVVFMRYAWLIRCYYALKFTILVWAVSEIFTFTSRIDFMKPVSHCNVFSWHGSSDIQLNICIWLKINSSYLLAYILNHFTILRKKVCNI